MASNNSQIHKAGHGHPKRAKLPDVNINTSVQIIDTERASLSCPHMNFQFISQAFLVVLSPKTTCTITGGSKFIA